MWLATPNSRKVAGHSARRRHGRFQACARGAVVLLGLVLGLGCAPCLRAEGDSNQPTDSRAAFIPAAEKKLQDARDRSRREPDGLEALLSFARACYELGELPIDNTERAELAHQGIAAAHQALATTNQSAAAHYYLGLNEGELARTELWGALSLVREMEPEFKTARAMDEHLDYAGPDRCLGLLYRDAPSFGSIGSRSKAREHLQRALELAPGYPDNQLNLIEAQLKWGEQEQARRLLQSFEASLPAARARFNGAAWAASWADWDARLRVVQKRLATAWRKLQTPREKG